MTEMSRVGSFGSIKPNLVGQPLEDLLALKAKQRWAPFGVEMKITDDENRELPWDGKKFGRLKVAGFAVASAYFKGDGGDILDHDGFFDTGDVATIDPDGYMQITDRAKDVIKSGGEWISSIDIENLAIGHPDILEAAVIGIAHPKWDERPLLVVVPKEGCTPQRDDVIDFLQSRIAKWWLPDDMQLVKEIPHTATGKINKMKLRETSKDDRLRTGGGGGGVALVGLGRGRALVAYPAWLSSRAISLPAINDVSTDLDPETPVSFLRSIKALEARGGRTPAEPAPEARATQQRAYP